MGRPSSGKTLEPAPVQGQRNPALSSEGPDGRWELLRQIQGWASRLPGEQEAWGQSGLSWALVAFGWGRACWCGTPRGQRPEARQSEEAWVLTPGRSRGCYSLGSLDLTPRK